MPPTFLLVAFIILLSFAAPIALVGALVLYSRPHTRALGVRMLRWGGCAAFGTMSANAAWQALLRDAPTVAGMLVGGGAAFTIACVIAIVRPVGSSQPSA